MLPGADRGALPLAKDPMEVYKPPGGVSNAAGTRTAKPAGSPTLPCLPCPLRRHTSRVPERFPVRVERFAVPGQRDAGAFLDDLGMLEAPGYLIGQPDGLVEVQALTGGGSFCLLGEPGAGKTTALETIVGRSPGRGRGRGLWSLSRWPRSPTSGSSGSA